MAYPYYPYYQQGQQYQQQNQTLFVLRLTETERGIQIQQLPVEIRFSGVCRYDPATGKYVCDISATKNFGLGGYEVRTARIEIAPANLELLENTLRGAIGGLLEEIEEKVEQMQTVQRAVQAVEQQVQRPVLPVYLF